MASNVKDDKESKVAIVGSTNQLKMEAVESILKQYGYKVQGLNKYDSKVSEYPNGRDETESGSLYRAQHCQKLYPNAHLWIGIESGFIDKNGNKFATDDDSQWPNPIYVIIAIVVIQNHDKIDKNESIFQIDNDATDLQNGKGIDCNLKDKEKAKHSKIVFWSDVLECPITRKQRFNQISNAFSANVNKDDK